MRRRGHSPPIRPRGNPASLNRSASGARLRPALRPPAVAPPRPPDRRPPRDNGTRSWGAATPPQQQQHDPPAARPAHDEEHPPAVNRAAMFHSRYRGGAAPPWDAPTPLGLRRLRRAHLDAAPLAADARASATVPAPLSARELA